ncbi:lytic murein transglycosylase [Maricaulis sp. D1M11]|uniref:lytic murein transglycosylase n=1 Tax=Maricaulis sp. D1M11 TaxID=3076117 RepID=UPI0039B61B9F
MSQLSVWRRWTRRFGPLGSRSLGAGILGAAAILVAGAAQAQPDGESFENWREDFRPRLAASGASAATVSGMLDGLEPNMTIIERDRSQPEFVRPLWSYLDLAVSERRILDGQSARNRVPELDAIAARYEVPANILLAIWGLESAYGQVTGDLDAIQSLATLAWEGRRRDWAESQLIAIGQMIDNGYASREELKGSWAGAMGQTQFIPTTYMERAQDWDGDGRRNIWTDEPDALASSAHLLGRAGWQAGAPIVVEVRLPDGFDLMDWDPSEARPVSAWAMAGLRPSAERNWRADELMHSARLELPVGRQGPGFLTFRNFRVIKRYNNSTAYALAVAHLADRFAGADPFVGPWPEENVPLTRSQAMELQAGLNALGYDAGRPDGLVGPNTRRALRAFQRAHGHDPDGYAGLTMHAAVREAQSD